MKFQLLPDLSQDDFERLKASIAERGVEVAVIVDEHGDIIDGHNRALIADSLGIRYTTETRKGLSDAEKRLLAVDLNLARRQLTDAQKVLIARQIEPDIAERARARQEQLGRTHGADPLVTDVTQGRTTDEVAKAVGLGSGRTYERAKQVIEQIESEPDGEQMIAALESGDWDMDDAREELRSRERSRAKDLAAAEQAEGSRMLTLLGEPSAAAKRSLIRADLFAGISATRSRLLAVDPGDAASVLNPDEMLQIRSFVTDLTNWLAAFSVSFETPLGLRVVGGQE